MVTTLFLTFCDVDVGKIVTEQLAKPVLNMAELKAQVHKGSVDHFDDFWIQKSHHFDDFWIQKKSHPFLRFLDPEIAPFLRFLDPEIRLVHFCNFWIQKLQYFNNLWIQK